MDQASEPWASSARRACAIRGRSPSSTVPHRQSRACCAILINVRAARERPLPARNMAEQQTEGEEAIVSTDPAADLQRERDDYYDRWMRKAAEFDNYRKRIERERREQS